LPVTAQQFANIKLAVERDDYVPASTEIAA